jgi:glycerol kinase
MAMSVPDTGGVYLVPAFTGLGAPYWEADARGTIVGITRGTTREHITRAALESIAWQTHDVVQAMEEDAGVPLKVLKVDGGASANDFLMQFQSDVLDCRVQRPAVTETTAWGAACLAGLALGVFSSPDDVRGAWHLDREFTPRMGAEERTRLHAGWKRAVACTQSWARSN